MKYIIKDGTNNNLFILLHGTGGDAESLLPLMKLLDPDATAVGIQGEVVEMGMNRYFARHSDGSFDLESLKGATEKLYQTIEEVRKENGLQDKRVIVAGYSNGANILQNLLKEYETDYDLGLIFHPAPTSVEKPFKNQVNLKALITSGSNDPYISPDQFVSLEKQLKEAGIPTELVTHDSGHSLIPLELDKAREMVEALTKEEPTQTEA